MTIYQPTLKELSKSPPEVVIVGAGINGVSLARELALRGVNVAVFDQGDVGSGTSSASSKLVHGGLRYLEQGHLGLVRESCIERERLLKNAPHLVWKCPFMFPIYQSSKRPLWIIRIGLKLYDFLSKAKQWPKHFFLDYEGITAKESTLLSDELLGAAVYQDAQMDDARLCLETALHARFLGAKIFTYMPVMKLIQKRQRAQGVIVKDAISGDEISISAKVVVSCVGPWADEWISQTDISVKKPLLKQSQGVHLMMKRLTQSDHSLLLTAKSDGRVFFVMPWGEYSLVGTTDTPYSQKMAQQSIRVVDRRYLLRELKHYFPSMSLSEKDIIYEFSGVRPLLNQSKNVIGSVSREHKVVVHYANFFSLIGGKYTTFRSVGESVSRKILRVLGNSQFKPDLSANLPFYGGVIPNLDKYIELNYQLDCDVLMLSYEHYCRLLVRYGLAYRDVMVVLSESNEYMEPIYGTSFLKGEVIYSIRVEMVKMLDDFLYRRTQLGWTQNLNVIMLNEIIALFSNELDWSDEKRVEELERYSK